MFEIENASVRRNCHLQTAWFRIFISICLTVWAAAAQSKPCGNPQPLGENPTRLVVIIPGTSQGPSHWASFLERLKKEPGSSEMAWLVFDHGLHMRTFGTAREIAAALTSCIQEKVESRPYTKITLIGHSVGGMLARRAYLEAAGAVADVPKGPDSWAEKVDKILLFASVNRGLRPNVTWYGSIAWWLTRTIPHPHFVLEDMALGSDFIADVRIAWIRHFGVLTDSNASLPRVVQFWGTEDSYVTQNDNADLQAFSGPVVIRVSDAEHSNLIRLEPEFTDDADGRWALFRRQLFSTEPVARARPSEPRRVLYVVRGIRDSSNSEWVSDLKARATAIYGPDNIQDPEYGYLSAAQFAMRPIRRENITKFRDSYAEELAKNPRTEFDFIGHSNGTYILGQALLSTPSMRFNNVALAAPVLPTEYDWRNRFRLSQIKHLRYDTARLDWAVGILCPMLRALGFKDVGPSGVVLFGEGGMADANVRKVGWHGGGHGAAISATNRPHLIEFAHKGEALTAGEQLSPEHGVMGNISRAVRWVVWGLLIGATWFIARRVRRGWRPTWKFSSITVAVCVSIYAVLDII